MEPIQITVIIIIVLIARILFLKFRLKKARDKFTLVFSENIHLKENVIPKIQKDNNKLNLELEKNKNLSIDIKNKKIDDLNSALKLVESKLAFFEEVENFKGEKEQKKFMKELQRKAMYGDDYKPSKENTKNVLDALNKNTKRKRRAIIKLEKTVDSNSLETFVKTTYKSAREAARDTGISRDAILRSCKRNGSKIRGYKNITFKFVNDESKN